MAWTNLFHEAGRTVAAAAAVMDPAGGDEQEVVDHLGDGGQDLPDEIRGPG